MFLGPLEPSLVHVRTEENHVTGLNFEDIWGFEVDAALTTSPPPRYASVIMEHLRKCATHGEWTPAPAELAELVGSESHADVRIALADGQPPVPAHRQLLCSGDSQYFSSMLQGTFREANAGEDLVLRLPLDVSRSTLVALLRFLYTGDAQLTLSAKPAAEDGSVSEAGASVTSDCGAAEDGEEASRGERSVVEILIAADALGMDHLRRCCECHLVRFEKKRAVSPICGARRHSVFSQIPAD